MKNSLISALLLFFVVLGFLSAQVLVLAAPAELLEAQVNPEEKDEQSSKESPLRRGKARGKKPLLSLAEISVFLRSALNSYPGNIHLLQVFRV